MELFKAIKKGIDTLFKKTDEVKTNKKGNILGVAVTGIIAFIVVAYMLQLTPTMLGAVISATPTQTGAMLGMQNNVTANIAAGGTLLSTSELVIPIIVILGMLLVGFGITIHAKA